MPFPQKTKFLKRAVGWEDLGQKEGVYQSIPKDEWTTVNYHGIGSEVMKGKLMNDVHSFCQTIINIGKENGELFKYCPRCMVKVD